MSNRKILIIHLSRLGDMIQSLPAVKLLKEDCPESEITYFGIENFCVPLKNFPWIDNLVSIPSHDIKGISTEDADIDIEAFDRLFHNNPVLTKHYDLLINMTHSRGSSYLSKRIKAKEKRGRLFSKTTEIVMSGKWGKYLIAAARHRNDNLLNLVDLYMGMAGVQHRPVRSYLPTNPEMDRLCVSRLAEHGFHTERITIGFQLGASKLLRTWPPEYFFRLGEFLGERLNAQIILFGSESERKLSDQFTKSAPFPFINLIGRTTLVDLPSFLKSINVLVSNDTGPMHIAAAVGTKVVGIFLGTADFRITGPYGTGHIAVQSNHPCAPCLDSTICSQPVCGKNISPEIVLQGVELALGLEVGLMDVSNGAGLYISDFDSNGTMIYKKLGKNTDCFLPRLRSFHDSRAWVSQNLWNAWLGLKPNSDFQTAEDDEEIIEITEDYKNTCLLYRKLYAKGNIACQNIVSEYRKVRPSMQLIQDMIAHISEIEQEIVSLESPLIILKEIHELYSAEIEYCTFPRLAHEFINKYNMLDKILLGFEGRSNQA